MGERRVTSWAGFALCVACCALGGCPESNGASSDGPLANSKDGPQNKAVIAPGTPGLDPPDTRPDEMGAAGAGSLPMAMNGGSGAQQPPTSTAGTSALPSAGTGAGAFDGGAPNADADAGLAPDAGSLCMTAQACAADMPCADASLHCIVVPSCMGPVCTSTEDACQLECGSPTCVLLESYPEQLRCD